MIETKKKEFCKEFLGCRIFLQGGCMWMHLVNQVWWQFTWHCCFVTSFFLLFSNQSCLWAQRGKNHNIWNIFCIQKPPQHSQNICMHFGNGLTPCSKRYWRVSLTFMLVRSMLHLLSPYSLLVCSRSTLWIPPSNEPFSWKLHNWKCACTLEDAVIHHFWDLSSCHHKCSFAKN